MSEKAPMDEQTLRRLQQQILQMATALHRVMQGLQNLESAVDPGSDAGLDIDRLIQICRGALPPRPKTAGPPSTST
jgi:hypothetical protein